MLPSVGLSIPDKAYKRVLFPEPLNQKAEAVMISNGINMEGNVCFSYNTFMSISLTQEEETKTYLIDLSKVEEKENENRISYGQQPGG